jgi:hypothetical protein
MDKYSNELNWAIAGRDLVKLKKLQDSIPSKPEIIIANIDIVRLIIVEKFIFLCTCTFFLGI